MGDVESGAAISDARLPLCLTVPRPARQPVQCPLVLPSFPRPDVDGQRGR